ncbi:hypothetical protein FORC88_913 [Salmonella enterica subsp. enterica serovar Typhimurium]|nr:hypothetical protein SEEOR701_19143 [Salmonella enterica subsp. enterica serovar Oranienburg str. 701]QCK18063.1 hypothetical protein FORC88_913 [Salmonella enterica subsp. enterica serovar Typhimurium]
MAFSCIKASPEKRGLFTLQVCTSHYWYTDYDYATAILVGAGNTKNRCASGNGMAVYPRWRGEHKITQTHPLSTGGLSPLARGTLSRRLAAYLGSRFIPAGAGNTIKKATPVREQPVYPRWRGEHRAVFGEPAQANGLSPLARGTPLHRKRFGICARFIPAGAGNTLTNS